jgi:MFS family permease
VTRTLSFLAIILTALALVPGGAHLAALPNKIDLPQDSYFIVQDIYRGWALFGIVLFGAVFANLAAAIMLRRERRPFWLSLGACLCIVATLVIFFIWTYPANQATDNWTFVPTGWEALRQQWECSHAINAFITFVALCLATGSGLAAAPGQDSSSASTPLSR